MRSTNGTIGWVVQSATCDLLVEQLAEWFRVLHMIYIVEQLAEWFRVLNVIYW